MNWIKRKFFNKKWRCAGEAVKEVRCRNNRIQYLGSDIQTNRDVSWSVVNTVHRVMEAKSNQTRTQIAIFWHIQRRLGKA